MRRRFGDLRLETIAAFRHRFRDTATGVYGAYGADAFALDMGAVTENERGTVLAHIRKTYEVDTELHFDTGIFGTPILLRCLCENGMGDLAFKLVTSSGFPSYRHMLESGATTLWETWDGGASHNHPMFGSVSAILFRYFVGIRPDEETPGFKKVIVHPVVPQGLRHVRGSVETVRGRVAVEWWNDEQGFRLDVRAPEGVEVVRI